MYLTSSVNDRVVSAHVGVEDACNVLQLLGALLHLGRQKQCSRGYILNHHKQSGMREDWKPPATQCRGGNLSLD